MKLIRFYDAKTGIFTPNFMSLGNLDDLEANTPTGFVAVACTVDHLSQRMDVETGSLVAYEPPPECDEPIARRVRATRDHLLSLCDWVVTKSSESGDPVPEAWRAYRQALRDVPGQTTFPRHIRWPEPPA